MDLKLYPTSESYPRALSCTQWTLHPAKEQALLSPAARPSGQATVRPIEQAEGGVTHRRTGAVARGSGVRPAARAARDHAQTPPGGAERQE